jgi:RecB family exonuclease
MMKRPVLADFRESLRQGRTARIVVPTATLAEHLRHELVRDGLVLRARDVGTLARFVQELAPPTKVVSSDLFHLMVEDALRRLDLPEFHKVRELAGFHARLAQTISDLDAGGCAPDRVAPFDNSVARVWRDIERQLRERNLVTRGESLRIAAEAALRVKLADDIWFEGFAESSELEIELAVAVSATFTEAGLSACPTTVVLVPETAEREVEEIARRILAQGNFRETGVILRKPEKYVALLRAAFERFGIPAHFYFSEPLNARLETGVVDCLLNGWDHAEVLELLRFIPNVTANDSLDAFSVKVRKSLPGRGLEPLLEMASFVPRRVLKSFEQIDAWRNERHTPAEWAARLSHLPSLFWPGHIPCSDVERYRSQAAGLKAFAKAMETAAEWWIDPSQTLDLAAFWQVARSVIRLSTFTTPPRSRNVVHVISAWEARQWDLSTIFVCGMVEKDFPAQNAHDPFFSDAVLSELGARTSGDKDEAERTLFEEVRAGARNLLVLSYPRTDSRGQRNLKSIFLVNEKEEANIPVVRPAIPAAIAPWPQPSRIESQEMLSILTERHAKVSVSALEKLLQCPFQFFSNRTLKIAELPCRPEDRLDFLRQGNIAHDFLHQWFGSGKQMEPLFTQVFEAACAKENIQPGYRTDRMRRLIWIALRRFMEDDRYPLHWPSKIEQDFELAVDDQLSIRGRLDRIDEVGEGRAIVIDYKFSNATATKNKLEDETKLQGPIYAWAAEKQFGRVAEAMVYVSLKGGEKPEYFGWGTVPGARFKKDLLPIPDGWIPGALQRASTAAAQFRAGAIHPRPANPDACRYCTYKDACRVEQPVSVTATAP